MKKNILFLLFFLSASVHAQEEDTCCTEECYWSNFYAKVLGGANFLQHSTINGNHTSYKAGYIVAGMLGFSWGYGYRVEAEYAFRRNGISHIDFFTLGSSSHGRFQTSSYMANLLWDIRPWTYRNILPFIGAGAGYDFEQMHSSNSRVIFDQKWHHFSWQLMAGFAYPIFCNTEMTLEYKFHQGGSQVNNHALGISLVYKFGFL